MNKIRSSVIVAIIMPLSFFSSCSSESEFLEETLNIVVAQPDNLSLNLTNADSVMIDSISKTNQYKDYAKATQDLIGKISPFMQSWNKENPIEKNDIKKETKYLITKLNNDKNLQHEWRVYKKTYNSFMEMIENEDLTEEVRMGIVMRVLRGIDKY